MQKSFYLILIVPVLLLAGVAAYGQQETKTGDDGRAYYDFGVFSYEDGNYEDAERNFKSALQFDPANPLYNHYLGKNYIRTGRYQEAAVHINQALKGNPDLVGLNYDAGFLKYKTGDYETAAAFLKQAAAEAPNNVPAFYYTGIALYKLEKYEEAAGYFITASEKSPTVRANGYYYAGICRYKSGKITSALEIFEAVRAIPDSGELGENASRWITALKQKEKSLKPWHLSLKVGRRYDDNARLEPDDLAGDTLADTDESDWATQLYFSGSYDFPLRGNYRAGIGYSHYQLWYDSLGQFDLTGSIPSLYVGYYLHPFTFRFTWLPTYYKADNDSYLRQHRLEPEILWRIGDRLLGRLKYYYYDNRYFEDEGKTGHANGVAADLYYSVLGGKGRVFGGIGYEDNTATDDDQYYKRADLRLGALFDLPWEMELGVTGLYQSKEYDSPDTTYGVKRDDDKYTGALSLSRNLGNEWLKMSGEYKYIQNVSNINDFEYSRNMFTISLTASY